MNQKSSVIQILKSVQRVLTSDTYYGISALLMRRALEIVGVDYVSALHRQHLQGKNCQKIARQNGLSVRTLRKLFNDRGLKVFRGHPRRRVSQAELAKAAYKARSVSEAARRVNLKWEPARRAFSLAGFLVKTAQGYEFAIPERPKDGWSTSLRI